MAWYQWIAVGVIILGLCRLIAEVYCRIAAARWMGKPEPGSLRLFSRGVTRPTQRLETLCPHKSKAPITGKFMQLFDSARPNLSNRADLAAFADGLVIGAGAYATAVASSVEAHSRLLEMPGVLDKVDIGASQIPSLDVAQQIGYENWLKGHISDSVSTDVLSLQHHNLAFDQVPNEQGWGLIVDGVPTDVQVGDHLTENILGHSLVQCFPSVTDMGDSSSHILEVGIPHEGAVSGAEAFVDHADAVDISEGITDPSFGIDVPVFTIATCAFRELSLSDQYGGDLFESLGAVAADAASVGLGAKVGGLGGAFLGPWGALIGAVAGATIARGMVRGYRTEQIKSDCKKLQAEMERFDEKWRRKLRAFDTKAQEAVNEANARLRKEVEPIRLDYEKQIHALSQEHDQATMDFFNNTYQIFSRFGEWLDDDLARVRRLFPSRPTWQRLLWPSMADAARHMAEKWIAAKRDQLEAWQDRFASIVAMAELTGRFDSTAARALLKSFTRTYTVWDESAAPVFKGSLDRFHRIARDASEAHRQAMGRVARALRRCEEDVRAKLERLWDDYQRDLLHDAQKIQDEMRVLMRRAGRDRMSLCLPSDFVRQRWEQVREYIREQTSGASRIEGLPSLCT